MWGLFYLWRGCVTDAETAFYFSGVTYTTIGYGDVVLAKAWRLLAPIEGLMGVLMFGLSTGYFFVVVSLIYQSWPGGNHLCLHFRRIDAADETDDAGAGNVVHGYVISSSQVITPTWASPRVPPPCNTRPTLGRCRPVPAVGAFWLVPQVEIMHVRTSARRLLCGYVMPP